MQKCKMIKIAKIQWFRKIFSSYLSTLYSINIFLELEAGSYVMGFMKVKIGRQLSFIQKPKGAFNNYVDQILPNCDHPRVDKFGHFTYAYYFLFTWPCVDFLLTLPPLVHVVVEWPPTKAQPIIKHRPSR